MASNSAAKLFPPEEETTQFILFNKFLPSSNLWFNIWAFNSALFSSNSEKKSKSWQIRFSKSHINMYECQTDKARTII